MNYQNQKMSGLKLGFEIKNFYSVLGLYIFSLGSLVGGFSFYLLLESIGRVDSKVITWNGQGLFWFLILFLGAIFSTLFGRSLLNYFDNLITRIPFAGNVYKAIKQITETFSNADAAYQKVVLIEYPRKGVHAIGFMTGSTKGEIKTKTKKEMVNVFVPTTPNPTSGFLLLFPEEDVIELDMSVEDAIKLVVSAGLVIPNE